MADLSASWGIDRTLPIVFSEEGIAYFGGDGGVSERPLPLAGCGSLSPEISDFWDDERRLHEPSFEPRSRVVTPSVVPPARFFPRPPSCARSASLRERRREASERSEREERRRE